MLNSLSNLLPPWARLLSAAILLCMTGSVAALTDDEARHLLHRTGFGVSPSQWQAVIDLDYAEAVDRLVDEAMGEAPVLSPPSWVNEKPLWTVRQRGWTPEQRRELRLDKRAKMAELREWWIYQMVASPTPLRERMTLFWSNHFTTQYNKSFAPMLIYRQHTLLREHALGRFDELLHSALRDPALLLYLDNDKNFANSVNENLARELMELFTLGEGHYTEEDVKEAARCLTGWGVDRATGHFRLFEKRHDASSKRVLGARGRFDGDGLADVLLDHPATAQRLVRKLWLEFISLEPDDEQIARWASALREDDYNIAALLKTLFKSAAFRAEENRGRLIKSPVELYVGLMRPALDGLSAQQQRDRIGELRAGKRLPRLLKLAGQDLFEPPSVEGWPGGLEWIDSRTLLSREQTARNLVMGLSSQSPSDNPYFYPFGKQADAPYDVAFINAIDPVTAIPESFTHQRRLLELIRDPTVHVK